MKPVISQSESLETDAPSNVSTMEGMGASQGIAIGPVYLFSHDTFDIADRSVTDIAGEVERFKSAIDRSEKELAKISSVTEQKIGLNYSAIFEAQIMMLHDATLYDAIISRIQVEMKSADFIAFQEISKYQDSLASSENEYLRQRASDIDDLKQRIIRNLQSGRILSKIDERTIVIAENLTPADIILFSRQNILGCAVDFGGETSHVALICRSLGIPIIVGLHNISKVAKAGDTAIIDGYTGKIMLNPPATTIEFYERKKKRKQMSDAEIDKLISQPARTACSHRIAVMSNIDFKEELPMLTKFGSDGVGLFRTENLFIANGKTPSEEEQYAYYREVSEALAPKPFTIRLFDIGGDKFLYGGYKEVNPNLGWRGIRVLLDVPEILDAQIRAGLRASTKHNIRIMIPMVSAMEEIRAIKKTFLRIKADLRKKKIDFDDTLQIGVMVEVPSAVEIIDEITREADFVSIGTNDLIQYTLAVDRNNDIVQSLYNKFHPAIVRMLARIIKAGKKNKCEVSLCGEMASEKLAVPLLLGLGLDHFSVVSSAIPELKKSISAFKLSEAKRIATRCLAMQTAYEIEHYLKHI
jgi:phosphotransferase system enzyme I (PtsI)